MGEKENSNVSDADNCTISLNVMKRLAVILCNNISKLHNPWLTQATEPRNAQANILFRRWHNTQILLLREFFLIVFEDAESTDRLFKLALDFIDGDTKCLVDQTAIRLFQDHIDS
jgi:hypothetical protein